MEKYNRWIKVENGVIIDHVSCTCCPGENYTGVPDDAQVFVGAKTDYYKAGTWEYCPPVQKKEAVKKDEAVTAEEISPAAWREANYRTFSDPVLAECLFDNYDKLPGQMKSILKPWRDRVRRIKKEIPLEK